MANEVMDQAKDRMEKAIRWIYEGTSIYSCRTC